MSSSASVDGETSVTACNSDEALSYIVPTSDDNRAATTPERSGGHQVGRGCNGSSVSDNMRTSSGPSFWPANADTVSTRTKPKKKRRRDRNRPIHEIHRLQTQVQGMERRLKALRPASSRATNELKALKDKLKKCLESTAAVDKLMQTQADELLQALPKSLAVTGRNLVYDVDEDDAVFQVLATTVDQHYVDLSRVFEAAGLRDAKSEIFDAYVNSPKSTTDSECVLKTRTCAFLPYARKLLEQAMWRRLECESAILPENIKSSRDLGPPMGSASNLIVSKREVHLDNASFTIRLAVKEYVEADRLVYVWDAIGDWPRAEAIPHVSTREYGWSLFTRSDCPDVSVLKSYVLVTATVTPPVDVELVERAMHLYRRTIESRYQKLENTLVDTSICSRK
ncbi:hypothetical protein PF005_g5496 [Phytophthora fragariae]|uniref:Uncharacterized protein n=2 Tax=Phytophthora fragariae TaxID=53985 RepID=A0A6A3YUZ8_9STRA|nr:hypothetical protein PF011_g4477 [Phytophthora fragariae]KAE9127366.1 hypothetical protein PF010_g4936 [Phytophthora fragariae]KAE9127638.1 hypothetical protein PF007_g5563 [Phytophthora fragariae]KAE9225530.1 hypothetical protein PF005_g5496 [Phytophthora fragariae]KAE9247533.1 hypothetical protein PF002_g6228 [Phytophthora fragariae]